MNRWKRHALKNRASRCIRWYGKNMREEQAIMKINSKWAHTDADRKRYYINCFFGKYFRNACKHYVLAETRINRKERRKQGLLPHATPRNIRLTYGRGKFW